MEKQFSTISNLETFCYFQSDFHKLDWHTGGKWWIHGIKHHKNNQFQNSELPVEYPSR